MRNKLFYSALFLLFFMPFALAGDITVFEATVYGSVVSVEVPDIIYLGNISSGFVGEEKRVDIVNTGTTDIIITPILIGDHDPIFEKLYFSKRLSGVDYSFGQTGEERCQNIMLFSSGKAVKAEIFTLWKRDLGSSKVIKDYTLSEEEKGVLLKYPKNVLVREQENITLCIKPLFEGDYEGVLILSPENGAMGVGSWIKFQSRMYNGEEKILSYPSLLHKSVRGEKSNTSFFLLFLIESTFIEGAAVVILSLFMRSRLHGSQ